MPLSKYLDHPWVWIPRVEKELTTSHVLSMSCMDGMVLNEWLASNPDQTAKIKVAQILNDIFIKGFYELHCIHADPNSGNFLISDTLEVSLLDFGCVRSFDPGFVEMYQTLVLKTAWWPCSWKLEIGSAFYLGARNLILGPIRILWKRDGRSA